MTFLKQFLFTWMPDHDKHHWDHGCHSLSLVLVPDTEKPKFTICPSSLQVDRYSLLGSSLVVPPATDNFGIKSYTIDPSNANDTYVAVDGLTVTFTVEDYAANKEECKTVITIRGKYHYF